MKVTIDERSSDSTDVTESRAGCARSDRSRCGCSRSSRTE